ncbi:hypothetical protein DQ04_00251130 [Trypanosoma grayi]|uniref:hypothetical protein n=1 Tax=Trypanosoma grayi TaxID=71804 RepID=UPI0004F44BEC|nr:hypothetical protein DQ04_00251130 [Trypanosoma grayi]KEG14937.1 hypothetical protein DQ04_00251130 [Trypanosoma grayi]
MVSMSSPSLSSSATMETSWSNLRSGDVLLMDRKCMAMRDPIGIAICLLNKTECRYDHVAMVMKLNEEQVRKHQLTGVMSHKDPVSPSGTYVLETNLNGVTLRALENRLARSSANRISARLLCMESTRAEHEKVLLEHLEKVQEYLYKNSVVDFVPSLLSTPDKMDRINAAHKMNLIAREVSKIDQLLPVERRNEDVDLLNRLREIYLNAAVFLSDTYFPHLERLDRGEFPSLNWKSGHFAVDGSNTEMDQFCSELIIRLWQDSGLLSGFPPASSFRPFDFLDDLRFNFIVPAVFLPGMVHLKAKDSSLEPMRRPVENTAPHSVVECLNFYHSIAGGAMIDEGVDSLYKWLVQSNTSRDVNRDLALNIVSTGVLFALCGLISAPLQLRWMECQLGVMLLRGSLWSLSAGMFARDLLCAATQGLTACVALRFLSQQQSGFLLGSPLFNTTWFDARHPYYYVCAVWFMANAVAHMVTTPLANAVVAQHFGPAVPGPRSLRTLLRGAVSLLPLGIILPYQAAWVTWYETAGSAIIPTPSSLLRRRTELIDTDEWRRFKCKALGGAFAATAVVDLVAYPLQRRSLRSFLAQLYKPASSPSYGRRLYAGYSYRFAGNMVTMFTTAACLSFLGVL